MIESDRPLWGVAPGVVRVAPDGRRRYEHDTPKLHRVTIREIGGIGEPNAGEFLVSTPCGYDGWVRQLNRNPDKVPACEACLNVSPSRWMRLCPEPEGETHHG